jgi:hypothetical protein
MQIQEVESNLYLNNKCQDLISSRDKFEQQKMLAKVLVCDRGKYKLDSTSCICIGNYITVSACSQFFLYIEEGESRKASANKCKNTNRPRPTRK